LNGSYAPNLYLALIHHPVVNKNGRVIASAVTNLDLHDIARAARTYGVNAFYVATPLEDQKHLIERILAHWLTGAGAVYNPKRRQALELVRVRNNLAEIVLEIEAQGVGAPRTVATCARNNRGSVSFDALRRHLTGPEPYLLMLGTAWGLAPELLTAADFILEPVQAGTDYNHLSVRSAAAIILDRLLTKPKTEIDS